MTETILQYEYLRLNLISALEFVAKTGDEIIHARYNEAGELVSFMDLNTAVGIVFDMIDIQYQPETAIGKLLVEQREADVVKLAADTLDVALPDDLFSDFDAAYVQTPDWRAAIATADTAYRLLEANYVFSWLRNSPDPSSLPAHGRHRHHD